ncbi:Glycine-rich RNA-binding protein blt801 [Camellia lanceoleosa]|nr:Glycine-rich RNA-binding protein blt801 [Camellia lanceoleosa]
MRKLREYAYTPTIPSYNQKIEVLKEYSLAVVENFLKDLHPFHWANAYFIEKSSNQSNYITKGTNVDDVDHGVDVDDVDYGAFSQFGEVIESKVRLIHTLQRSDLFRGSVPNGQDLDGRNITFNEAQSRRSGGGGGGGFRGGGGRREGGYGGGGCR